MKIQESAILKKTRKWLVFAFLPEKNIVTLHHQNLLSWPIIA